MGKDKSKKKREPEQEPSAPLKRPLDLEENVQDVDDAERERKRKKKEKKAAKKAAKKGAKEQEPVQPAAAAADDDDDDDGDKNDESQAAPAASQDRLIFDLESATEEELLRILAAAPSLDGPQQQSNANNAPALIDPQLQGLAQGDKQKGKEKAVPDGQDIQVAAGTSEATSKPPLVPKSKSSSATTKDKPAAKSARKRNTKVDYSSMDAEEILTTNWVDLKIINQLADEMGFEVKRGMYSKDEDEAIEQALLDWQELHSVTRDEVVHKIIHPPRDVPKSKEERREAEGFWTFVSKRLVGRPMRSVHRHTQSLYNPSRRLGAWQAEELQALDSGYAQFGPAWTKISELVGRSPLDVRTKWREMNPELSGKYPRRSRGKVDKSSALSQPIINNSDDESNNPVASTSAVQVE